MNTMRSKRNQNRKRENKNWRENLREALPLRERGEKKRVNLRNCCYGQDR